MSPVDPDWGEPHAVHLPPEYQELLRFQHNLHADSLFIGCFSTAWARLQHNYLRLNNLPCGRRQAATALKKLLLHLLNLASCHVAAAQQGSPRQGRHHPIVILQTYHTPT
jgi:hypothetical protein